MTLVRDATSADVIFCAMETTFQDRMNICIDRAGSQTKLARIVSALRGEKVSPQSIQTLASRTQKIPAQGSTMCASIAMAAGVRAQWLEYGEEPMLDPFGKLDPPTYALLMTAAAKLLSPQLDADVRNTAMSALRTVAKQDIGTYTAETAPQREDTHNGQKKHAEI